MTPDTVALIRRQFALTRGHEQAFAAAYMALAGMMSEGMAEAQRSAA